MIAALFQRRWVPYALFIVVFLAQLPLVLHDLSPDQISYLNVAALYRQGNWSEAVNGFWSPLLSWILVALLLVCGDPWLAAVLARAALGLLALYAFQKLARVFLPRPGALLPVLARLFTAAI